jgi:hypothetical protein
MKKDQPRVPSQVRPLPARHQFDHQVPTVIHDPEENMMLLARWTHRAMKNQTRFWGTIIGIVAGVLAIVVVSNLLMNRNSGRADLWSKLETAKSPADRLQVAEDNPNSPVATWAKLQAATEFYNQGFSDLPNNRDVALPNLKKALDLFDDVARQAPSDSPQARAAALGKARTLEARNELSKAIEQYRLVEKTWPDSAEASLAKQMAAELEKPGAAAFYKELYAYSPTKVTLPAGGTQDFNFPPGLDPGAGLLNPDSGAGGSLLTRPLLPPPPPLPVTKDQAPAGENKEATPAPGKSSPLLPESPFVPSGSATPAKTNTPAPTPKAETPKAEAPKTQPKPAPTPAQSEKTKS